MIAATLLVLQVAAAEVPFDAATVPEPVLATQRGGIRLPNGIDVTLSIDTVTALDGRIVLQTVTRIDEGAPQTQVYAPGAGENVALPAGEGGEAAWSMPTITYDKQNGIRVSGGGVPLFIGSGSGGSSQVAEGLEQVDPSSPVTTANGVIARDMAGVSLEGADIRVTHLTGDAIGSAIANSGNDRAIDTLTNLSIDLSNAGPDVIGSAMLRVEGVALDAMGARF